VRVDTTVCNPSVLPVAADFCLLPISQNWSLKYWHFLVNFEESYSYKAKNTMLSYASVTNLVKKLMYNVYIVLG
jgi:hypothetical protein